MSASIRVADESINAAVAAAPPAVPDRPLKCVFIGECGVGKTSLLVRRVLGEFPSNYLPMITDNYDVQVPRPTRHSQAQPSLAQSSSAAASASLAADSTTAATAATTVVAHTPDTFVKVVCWDTAGQEDYDRVRPLAYVGADCFAVCFSIGDPGSLENMRLRWHPELQHHAPSLPRLLVGLKSDLRTSEPSNERLATQPQPDQPLVTPEAAQAMAQEIGAAAYLECSAVTKAGMDALFERIAQVALAATAAAEAKQKPRRCAIM